jgi:Fuc2NAc and GlcNAc transferase
MTKLALDFSLFGIALFATGCWRRIALSRSLLDVPNSRSSHSQPIPRGGGVAIVFAFFLGVAYLTAGTEFPRGEAAALFLGGGLVAGIGLVDDFVGASVGVRLLCHVTASALAVWLIHGAAPVLAFGRVVDLGKIGDIIAVVYLVGLLNLYNFMDGIDGIAAAEAVTVCLGAAAILFIQNDPTYPPFAPLMLAAASLGFLLWNFPKSTVFMGDVGSGFLGFAIGVFSLASAHSAPRLLWCWLILLGVFVVDSTLTILRRLIRGERVYEAHRSHAYQHAARRFGSHPPVTWFVIAVNVCWLTPLAIAVGTEAIEGITGLAIAYAPLVVVALLFDAGSTHDRTSA